MSEPASGAGRLVRRARWLLRAYPAAYRAAGRLAEAIPLLEATLAGREQVLGHTHPSTVKSRSNLASAYQEGGQS
jgi:hypothetical protein